MAFMTKALIITLALYTGEAYGRETLHIGVLISQQLGAGFDYSGFLPALSLALDTVNNDSSLRYRLSVTVNNSLCEAASSLRSFIDQIFSQSLIMLIGSDCSVATEPVAEIAPNWNLVQISPASTSPRLSNKKLFPLFLRTVSSDAEVAVGVTAVMKKFGWSRVALITQSENIFTFVSTEIKSHLNKENLQLIGEHTFNTEDDNVEFVVDVLKNSPARVIFLNMYQEFAIKVMCEILEHQLTHPKFAWMFFTWYNDKWWTNTSCTINDPAKEAAIENILLTSLLFDHYSRIDEEHKNVPNVGNITWNDYESYYYHKYSDMMGLNVSAQLEDSAYMFDAVWAAALVLNNTNDSLVNFMYNSQEAANISQSIHKNMIDLNFFGLTGTVSFQNNGDRPARVRVLQYRQDDDGMLIKVPIGKVENGSLVLNDNESVSKIFQDGIAEDEEYIHIVLPLFVTYTVLSLLGTIFAIVCLVFNLWFREQKLVKLTSPYVNVMIIAGAVIFYITVILFGVDENVASFSTVDHLCQTKIWLVAIGFSLLFGTIFAKTWRIYYIFNHFNAMEMKDIYLFAIVGVLVLVDIVILIPPTAVSSAILRREQEEVEGDNAGDLPEIIGVCKSDDSLPWLAVLLVYKGLVLLAGLFLAFETRKIKIISLNESRFVAMSVYGAVIASIALTPIGLFLQDFPSVQYGILGMVMLLITTLILGLVFVSKMYKVFRDPEGTRSLDRSTSSATTNKTLTLQCSNEMETYKRRIQSLNVEIIRLNDELEMSRSGEFSEKSLRKRLDLEATLMLQSTETDSRSVSPQKQP
ncbi:gamma-aminobutyric acid type B receptor subunit 2-like [Dysidea avara]|uniref:gamma-aminobutyric acid type B receptor subunit 2-like n=1 Tax=Dysidea avara TaxID=196820 RepID=UPI0033340229